MQLWSNSIIESYYNGLLEISSNMNLVVLALSKFITVVHFL
jgi:hypothetical protein